MDPNTLQGARQQSQQLSQKAIGEQEAGANLPNMLREALNKKFSSNNPLIQEREGAVQQYLNAGTQAPLNVTPQSAGGNADVVFNPLQQANLIQQERSVPLSRLTTLNDLLGLQTGSFSDIIDSASRAQQANTQELLGRAQLARQNYEDLLSESQGQGLLELSPGTTLFDPVSGRPVYQSPFKPSSGGSSGLDLSFLGPLLEQMLPQQQPSESEYIEYVNYIVENYGIDEAERMGLVGAKQYGRE